MDQFNLKDVLATFSPEGDYLALCAGDGRVKIWDVGNGQLHSEFVDIGGSRSELGISTNSQNGHLALEYTTISWSSKLGADKKGKRGNKGGSSLLALGTRSGEVLAWDITVSELKWRIKDCNTGGVLSITFSKNGQSLYYAGLDGMVCELDSNSGKLLDKFRAAKAPISCIAASPGGDLFLAGTSELKLFDLSSKKRLHKFTGHPVCVRNLIFTPDGKYVLSSGVEDRHVAVWSCEERTCHAGAAFVLSMEHPAVSIHCSSFDPEQTACNVLAVSEAGVTYVWQAQDIESLAKAKPWKVSVLPVSRKNSSTGKVRRSWKPCVLAAKLLKSKGEGLDSVLVAYGSTAKPAFEHVSLGQSRDVVLEAPQTGALLSGTELSHQNANKVLSRNVTILGPDNAADAVFLKGTIESELPSNVHSKKRRASNDKVEGADSELVISKGGSNVAQEIVPKIIESNEEPTMEERLIALGLLGDKHANENALNSTLTLPKADSVEVLLSQALESDDNALVERCLAISNEKVIANTVRKLQSSEAAKFLQVSISKIDSRPGRGLTLIPWVRAVLLHHAAFIMSNPSMQSVLTSLYQIIDARLSAFRPLLSLAGRLELITAQICANEARDKATNDADVATVYEEEDSEQEVEDVMERETDGSDLSESDVDDMELDAHKDMHPQESKLNISEESDEDDNIDL